MRPVGKENAFVVLGAGGVEYRKGVDLFIVTASAPRGRAPEVPWHFVWIGGDLVAGQHGDFRLYLADQIDRSSLSDIVTFLPATPDIELAYRFADAFFLSSRLEPLGNVAIDALAEGLPVTCFDKAAGMVDFLQGAGLSEDCVAPYLDTVAMADLMIALTRSSGLRESIAGKARKLVQDKLMMPDYAADLLSLAETAVREG
jgi:glycosyltransferase involved in cell wall biosynthesis